MWSSRIEPVFQDQAFDEFDKRGVVADGIVFRGKGDALPRCQLLQVFHNLHLQRRSFGRLCASFPAARGKALAPPLVLREGFLVGEIGVAYPAVDWFLDVHG